MLKYLKYLSFGIYANTGEKKLEANWGQFIRAAFVLALLVAIIKGVFPSAIPYEFFGLWSTKGTVLEWMKASWPILLWAGGLTLLVSLLTRNSKRQNDNAEEFLGQGLWVSLRAGVMEEIIFRWLMFMLSIPMVIVFDWLLGGFIFNHGLLWVIYHYILFPVADFFTFGLLTTQLRDPAAWTIAAGVLSANASFRDGHKYQGLIGMINSWVIGMYMFYLLFTFGLVAAIAVHFVYDALIFTIRYLDRVQERVRGVHGTEDLDE